MKTVVITKLSSDGSLEKTISLDGDAEDTAFVLDMLGMIRTDFPTTDAPDDPEPTLQ